MKYIDAEKLKTEIDKILAKAEKDEKKALLQKDANGHLIAVTKTAICAKIKKLITSLQQEQTEVDLEKELDSFIMEHGDWDDDNKLASDIASHFYELGQRTKYQQDREEFAKLKAKEWQSGYDEGYAKGLNARKEE